MIMQTGTCIVGSAVIFSGIGGIVLLAIILFLALVGFLFLMWAITGGPHWLGG